MVNKMIKKEIDGIKSINLKDSDRDIRLKMIEENRKYFERVLDENEHNKANPKWRNITFL